MKTFEISNKQNKNGRRKFKLILHEIFPDSCIDEEKQVGTKFNENGITWIEQYCENALPSITGMSLRCEFLDEDRTELCGHGLTDIVDGLPIYENAVVIGTFSRGYIQDIETDTGVRKFCIGEGEIDSLCYNNYVKKLEFDINNDDPPQGSVEILKTGGNDGIVYKYGYKDKGRIPTIFEYSGYALLGIRPSDQSAKILELNNKEELKMTEAEVRAIVAQVVQEMSAHTAEMNQCKDACDAKIVEANEKVAAATSEKEEALANIDKLQKALEEAEKERAEAYKKVDGLYNEIRSLEEEIAKAKTAERLAALDNALGDFSDDEKSYAKSEIEAFKAEPIGSEINSVVSKIWEGIGKKAKADSQKVVTEQNSAQNKAEDIFAEVDNATTVEDTNIF